MLLTYLSTHIRNFRHIHITMLIYNNAASRKKEFRKVGSGLLNKFINKLPVELHIPTYNFCGPGTKLNQRLLKGDQGINPLDEACKEHDIAYSKFPDIENRHRADKILEQKALERVKAGKIGEKIAALGVMGAMKVKRKLGMGLKRPRKGSKKIIGRGITFNKAVKAAREAIVGTKYSDIKQAAKSALTVLKRKKIREPRKRIIQIPKTGGFLPLIPLFAGLSALGALSGGAAGIAKAVNDAKTARDRLEEDKRHNRAMEDIKVGKGLYLKPYKQGCGLYLKPYQKNC